MGLPTPDDNYRGYEEASLNNKVDNFKNKLFFLIHGTLDDNVHYQQSMMLAKALETNDILFEQQVSYALVSFFFNFVLFQLIKIAPCLVDFGKEVLRSNEVNIYLEKLANLAS